MTARVVRLGGRGWDCNQYLVKDPKANAFDMVDAGHGQDWDHVLAQVQAVTDPSRIGTVYLTHEHLDHVNGVPRWHAFGAKVAASPVCARKLHDGHDPTSAAFGMDIPRVEVDRILDDGTHVSIGGQDHEVLLTPGHCPGAACYWDATDGVLFAGDTVFDAGGIGRFDFPDSDLAQLHASIRRLARLPAQVLYCGHGPSPKGDAASRSLRASLQHVEACMAEAG